MTPNDLDMFKVNNTNMHVTHTHTRPKFSSVLLYDEQFSGYSPIFGKVQRMNQNDLDMFKVKNTNMHAKSTPGAQIFVSFALR